MITVCHQRNNGLGKDAAISATRGCRVHLWLCLCLNAQGQVHASILQTSSLGWCVKYTLLVLPMIYNSLPTIAYNGTDGI